MGYTITIRPRTRKLGEKMRKFMAREMRSCEAMMGLGLAPAFEPEPCPPQWAPKNLSYCHRKGHLGFDYGADFEDREYLHTVLRWMALKIGDKPRYLYDGSEWVDVGGENHDELGLHVVKSGAKGGQYGRGTFGLMDKINRKKRGWFRGQLRSEMARLDMLWAKELRRSK